MRRTWNACDATPKRAGLIIESGIADPLERVLLRVEPEEVDATASELAAAARVFQRHRGAEHDAAGGGAG